VPLTGLVMVDLSVTGPEGGCMTLNDLLKDFKSAKATMRPNYMKIPVTRVGMDEIGAKIFNDIYFACKSLNMRTIPRTSRGSISTSGLRLPCWDVRKLSYCVEITILGSRMYRIQFRGKIREMDQEASGRRAFTVFKRVLDVKFHIKLEEFAITNGKDIKKDIEVPLIKLERETFANLTFDGVHHIDFHSSYPAGLIATHPEFDEAVTYMYHMRKIKEIYKSVLDFTIGFMQSQFCGYRYTHLARDAIKNNNDRIKALAEALRKSGRIILMYNTDGIWYKGDVFHGEGEGTEIGQWSNDHVNCRFRAKSAGCYEFIEDGVYVPKVRGRTKLESIKPREAWQWGDIYNKDCVAIKWIFDEVKGVIQYEEEKN